MAIGLLRYQSGVGVLLEPLRYANVPGFGVPGHRQAYYYSPAIERVTSAYASDTQR